MTAGQVLMLGSSAIGQGSSDILVYNPGLVAGPIGIETIPTSASFSCNAQRLAGGAPASQGMITSRARELAGPDTIPTGGVPNAYVPATTQRSSGVTTSPSWARSAPRYERGRRSDVASRRRRLQYDPGTSVAAWDATVRRPPLKVNITGRVFSYYLALFTASNGLPVFRRSTR